MNVEVADREKNTYEPIDKEEKVTEKSCISLLAFICIFNVFLKASYSICPPFLPVEAIKKGVPQSYLGMMFSVYSLVFAIASPLVGIYLASHGRRNFLVIGTLLMFVANAGFVLMHYINHTEIFIAMFVLLRIIQGIGTGIIQTANYAILSVIYPKTLENAISNLESAAGFGLCFGPLAGVLIFSVGGYVGSFSI